jgi:transposase
VINWARRVRVYAYGEPADMRKSFDTLSALVREKLKQDVLDGALYVFVGKDCRRAKVLFWDGTGLCVFAKRLEKGRFAAPWARKAARVDAERARPVPRRQRARWSREAQSGNVDTGGETGLLHVSDDRLLRISSSFVSCLRTSLRP